MPEPKPLLSKLGAKPTLKMAALGFTDRAWTEDMPFDSSLESGATYDLIVLHVKEAAGLKSIQPVKHRVADRGGLWIVYPRGVKVVTQAQVMFAGNANAWTDVKVCRFSETDTALKFVRRLK